MRIGKIDVETWNSMKDLGEGKKDRIWGSIIIQMRYLLKQGSTKARQSNRNTTLEAPHPCNRYLCQCDFNCSPLYFVAEGFDMQVRTSEYASISLSKGYIQLIYVHQDIPTTLFKLSQSSNTSSLASTLK